MMAALEKKLGSTFSRRPTLNTANPLLIVISGPSGVGKDAVINRLQEVKRDMHFVVTATTRPMREGEVHGKDYIFMDKAKFEDLIEKGELLEHALVYGDYKGIPKQQVRKALGKGTDVVLRLDVQGAAFIRKLIPESISIFLVAESERALVKRLLARKTEPLDAALVRVETARKETQRIAEFDFVVENPSGKLDETVEKICSIIDAEKVRVKQHKIRI
jgi:guanylate kinase